MLVMQMQHTEAAEGFALGKLDILKRRMFSPSVLRQGPVFVRVVHHDGFELQGHDSSSSQQFGLEFGFEMIRMECTTGTDLHEAFAILQYNYAICRLAVAINTKTVSQQKKEHGAVCQPLHAALAMLNKRFDLTHFDCPFVTKRVLNLMTLIGQALVSSMEALGRPSEANVLRVELLGYLERASNDLAATGLFSFLTAASPAA
jgi:hypothetical protein